jgi:tRNA(Ile)-lysidine synthase
MPFQEQVKRMIERHKLLSPGDRVLVAVSGGPDSVALMHVLCSLREELGLHMEVAHLQHGIRGEEAREDARFVAELAKKMKLPFHLSEVNVPRMRLAAGKGNLEALAREERYRFFADMAREQGFNKVATAHTQDDQAETMLMWLLRGSGRKGLGGMAPIGARKVANARSTYELTVIRPLLDLSKAEILEYLELKRLAYRVDRTNQDIRLLRNWIRLELIPKLKERSDPHFSSRLAHQAELLRDEDGGLEGFARTELGRIRRADGLDRESFLKQPVALQRLILRLWIEETRGHLRAVDFAHVDALLKLIADGAPQSRRAIPGGWELVKEYETLRLERRARNQKRLCYSHEYRIGTALNISEAGMTLQSERILAPLEQLPDNLMEAVFDAAELPETLTVRNFRQGDRFQPLGMAGRKKVKDLYIEKKVPLSVRSRLPLLATGEEILWIPGYGRSEAGKIGPRTKEIVSLRVLPWRS